MKGYLFAEGKRVARVDNGYEQWNSWSETWDLVLKKVEFDEGHKAGELFDKWSMLILLDENETTFYDGHLDFAKHHSSGVELRMTFQRKETGTFQQKETGEAEKKMEVKIIDENSTLKEVQEFCKNRGECSGCPIHGGEFCRMRNRPDNWDLNFRPPFSEDELAWMRVMTREVGENEQMWLGKESSGALYWKIENQDGSESGSLSLPRELFPQIQPGQWYDVRKVLGENEQ